MDGLMVNYFRMHQLISPDVYLYSHISPAKNTKKPVRSHQWVANEVTHV